MPTETELDGADTGGPKEYQSCLQNFAFAVCDFSEELLGQENE